METVFHTWRVMYDITSAKVGLTRFTWAGSSWEEVDEAERSSEASGSLEGNDVPLLNGCARLYDKVHREQLLPKVDHMNDKKNKIK